jgi:hypothetical protein
MKEVISCISVYNKRSETLTTKIVKHSNYNWRDLLALHPEFIDDSLEWLSSDFSKAVKQLLINDLVVSISHYYYKENTTKEMINNE